MYFVLLFRLNRYITSSYGLIMSLYLCVLAYYIYIPQKMYINGSDKGISSDTITSLIASDKIFNFKILCDCQDNLKGLNLSPSVFSEK